MKDYCRRRGYKTSDLKIKLGDRVYFFSTMALLGKLVLKNQLLQLLRSIIICHMTTNKEVAATDPLKSLDQKKRWHSKIATVTYLLTLDELHIFLIGFTRVF